MIQDDHVTTAFAQEHVNLRDEDEGRFRVFGAPRRGVAIERADWPLVGEIKTAGGLSLGDAHAVALADELEATLVVGADGEFDDLPVDIEIERILDHGV